MPSSKFIIRYQTISDVTYPNATAMKKYLDYEAKIWSPFLEEVRNDTRFANVPVQRSSINGAALADAFERFIKALEDPREFANLTREHGSTTALPPPSTSIEGQLILGLLNTGRPVDALCVYTWFINHSLNIPLNNARHITDLVKRGDALSTAAYAAAAIPFRNVTSQKLSGAVRSAEAQADALGVEVENAQQINQDHDASLISYRDNWIDQARRMKTLAVRREKHRRKRYASWQNEIDAEVKRRFDIADTRLDAVDRANKKLQLERQKEFDRLLDLFQTQLRLRAPVKLWEGRSTKHSDNSNTAFILFGVMTLIAIIAGAAIPFVFGDYIAGSFFTITCDLSDAPVCERVFSAKGPLTVAGILVIMSLLMWAVRLQYRIYLSERHLALDASEKQAFAETYLAMKEGEDVGSGNEAIVLASLFRPTQDGIIKDDDGSMDLSAIAILARQLGRTPG